MGGRRHQPTELFGSYQVFEKIGTGGMAVVHRAVKVGIAGFEREVALKRLLPHMAENPEMVQAFVREAKLASRLHHPNIAHIYELGKEQDSYFISMELVEGQDLRRVLRRLARDQMFIPVRVAVAILLELCDALDHAHSRADDVTGTPLDIVHRDISPSNLVITHRGHLKVIDFGIAKAAPEELATRSGRVKGKFGYMSPEALRGQPLDGRSDIFSAGVVAHELLTSRRLFGSTHSYQTIANMHQAEIAPPSRINPRCPPDLDQLVLSALERDPDDRFDSAEKMRDALYRVALNHKLEATSDQIAEYMDFLFGEPVEIVIEPPPSFREEPTDDSVEVLEEFTLVNSKVVGSPPPAVVQPVNIELPPPPSSLLVDGEETTDLFVLPSPGTSGAWPAASRWIEDSSDRDL